MSKKGDDWQEFSTLVALHIENYVIPQYGDKCDDEVNDYNAEDCAKQIKKYAARYGRNSRPEQEELDFIKMAHYAQLGLTKLKEQKDATE